MRLFFLISILTILSFSSCTKTRYPCPGNGQYTPQQLSLFDEEGDPKSGKKKKKGRKNEDTGLLNKKKDPRLRNRRKTSLDDKPKNMRK